MPKFVTDTPFDLCRYIDGFLWRGHHFSESREENKALAKYLRGFGIPVRCITLPATSNTNYGMNAPERYVIYRPNNLLSSHNIDKRIQEFYARQDAQE